MGGNTGSTTGSSYGTIGPQVSGNQRMYMGGGYSPQSSYGQSNSGSPFSYGQSYGGYPSQMGRQQQPFDQGYNDSLGAYKSHLTSQEGWNPEWQGNIDKLYKTASPYESWMRNQTGYKDWYGSQQAPAEVSGAEALEGTEQGIVEQDTPGPTDPYSNLQSIYSNLGAEDQKMINDLLGQLGSFAGNNQNPYQQSYQNPYQQSYRNPYQQSYQNPYSMYNPSYQQGYNPFYGGYY